MEEQNREKTELSNYYRTIMTNKDWINISKVLIDFSKKNPAYEPYAGDISDELKKEFNIDDITLSNYKTSISVTLSKAVNIVNEEPEKIYKVMHSLFKFKRIELFGV